MKEYWDKLSLGQKVVHIFWGILGLYVLIFALVNWKVIDVNFVLGTSKMPVTVLIVISMFGGYGYAKIFGFFKGRKKDKEINYLKGEVAVLREKVRKPTPVSNTPVAKDSDSKKVEE